MPRGILPREARIQMSVARLKKGIKNLQEQVVELKRQNKVKDRKIEILEALLANKEAQRKELLSHLYKPSRDISKSR